MKLYHFYQSSASYRIRIAMNYKKLDCALITVDLSQREQLSDEYRKHNQHGRVPALEDEGFEFGQSSAILEYLAIYHKSLLVICIPL
jgi:glutathione S-transferase